MAAARHIESAIIFLRSAVSGGQGDSFGTFEFYFREGPPRLSKANHVRFEPTPNKDLIQAVARVDLGIEGKVPPKAAAEASRFGGKFPVTLR